MHRPAVGRRWVTDLAGYVLEPLQVGSEYILYRGRHAGSAAPLLVLAPAAAQQSAANLKRLEHEYALASELDPAWAVQPVSLARFAGHMTLVLEDPGGEPLTRLLGEPLEISEFLRIAIALAEALRRVHERGLIHKDIKPANVLVVLGNGGLWLTGFGIASRLPRERQDPEPPEEVAGTFAYMAPEQTGRMNRSIDSRSDLYALGITFYEMLTGTLPFRATDPMEWIHCHIARQPVSPSERVTAVPAQLSAVVTRLLAKTAEERYQTAAGVAADLRRCQAAWESFGRIEPFSLGTQDASDRLMIPERLYGRKREIDALLAAFDRVVAQGTPELVLVPGYSGVGKSSVVNELHTVLVPPRGLFAAGKFDQYKRDIPYATLAQALRTLVRQILAKSEAEVEQWRYALTQAVEPNGQLIVGLVPEVEVIIGKQPPVPDLPPRDAQNRFQMVFRRFLGAFARPEHPLALFLDDLQWLDAATLDLLEHLLTHSDVRHLLLVGAYRDNEVSSSHPLLRTLEAIRKAGARVQEIVLAPLGLDHVGQLVADALHCEPERVRPLAQLVHEKTGGNPFFAIQFFTALADEGLLAFNSVAPAWQWDMDRIRSKSYTDNVVDFMAERLKRLSAPTQEALKQLACLGNVADVATLALVHRETEEAIHADLREAIRAGLIFQQESTYKFLHDRIQQAAYSSIPDKQRAEVHLALGRVLMASMTADQLAEHLFDIANQLNRGGARLVDREEKTQVATIDLRAGRKAKTSAAYASACAYLAAGMALLDERDWGSQYNLMFSLRLERAECEFLTGNFDTTERLIGELLQRGASKVDQAAAYHLKVLLHTVKSENAQAVASALTGLRLFGIDLPAHPTRERVQAEYEMVWSNLEGRPIESLIDLPLMTDPELQAAMTVLSALLSPAFFTDLHLYCLYLCRMLNVSMQHGTSGASAHAYGDWGAMLGPVFHRYGDAHRFAKLACDLVEKHGFIAHRAKVRCAMGAVAFWTQPIAAAIDSMRSAFRAGIETGDLTFACYGMFQSVTGLLLRNDPLDAVWRESQRALDFARDAKYGDAADIIGSQHHFIATLQGRTGTFSTFSGAQCDEATFEAQLTGHRMPVMICFYWILKLKARFLSGDYAEALAAADKVKPLLWAIATQIQLLDYFYYATLTVTACYENASADEKPAWRELLTAHQEQLREWADNYPPTFGDKHALVSAELARIEGRDLDAMRLYEEAIRAARENGFIQNEALGHEVAARFYAARGFETISHAYLQNARSRYLRWGAVGKVRQMDLKYPQLVPQLGPLGSDPTIGTPVEQLDLATVVKVSQAVSGEIDFNKLIGILMETALEHAGGERGLLILPRGEEMWIAAEATTAQDRVIVCRPNTRVAPAALPESVYHYVIRTRDRVLLDDASKQDPFAADEYVRRNNSRSILCLPLIKQANLIGVLYLENSLASHVFTPARIAVLRLLASQAATSLENARLYSDLRDADAYLAEAQRLSHTGSFRWSPSSGEIHWSEETFRIFEFDRATTPTVDLMVRQRIHPEDVASWRQVVERAAHERQDFAHEYRLRMPDGRVKHLHVVAHAIRTETDDVEFVGAVKDVTEEKRAQVERERLEQRLRQAAKMEAVGRFAGGIAHDFNSVLAGVFGYGELLIEGAPPESSLKRYAQNVLTAATRGRELVNQILTYSRSQRAKREPVDVAHVVAETLELIRGSLPRGIALEATVPEAPIVVIGDAIQLHQVVMNLCSNAIQAMSAGGTLRVAVETADVPSTRALSHGTLTPDRYVRLTVEDCGCGMDEDTSARIFEPFFTTKAIGHGTGLGLSLVYGIITDWGGAIDVKSAPQQGCTFTIYLRTRAKTNSGVAA
jgi:predicted ATPase/signal transduction histidine kinase